MWGESDLPHLNAILGVSFLMFINLTTVFMVLIAVINNQFLFELPNSEYYAGAFFLLLVLISYVLLIRDGKYLKIAQEFKKESIAQKRKGLVFVWLYIIVSFILYPVTILLIKKIISS
jgi:hypothetical protein